MSEWRDQVPVLGDANADIAHAKFRSEHPDVGRSERDALREEVSILKAQVADLTSKMSSQMEEILARLNAEPSPVRGTHTIRW